MCMLYIDLLWLPLFTVGRHDIPVRLPAYVVFSQLVISNSCRTMAATTTAHVDISRGGIAGHRAKE